MTDYGSLPVVSCLVTVYNHERYIVQALEGALIQGRDYPTDRLEIIVVDDDSTDSTPGLIEPYRDRVRFIQKPNGGTLSTVNRALEEATGELFCFLSGDDLWYPGKIRRQVDLMLARPEVTAVYGDMALIDGDGQTLHASYYDFHALPRHRGDLRGPLLEKNCIAAVSVMMRTWLRERFAPIAAPAVWEDWWMYHHAAEAGAVEYLPGADVAYRIHGANLHGGIAGEEQLRLIARELPFRRWLLTETDLSGIPVTDLLAAWRAFEWHAATIAQAGLGTTAELIPVGGAERARAAAALEAAARAREAGDLAAAAGALIRALAWDPGVSGSRDELARVLARREAQLHTPTDDVRGLVLLASGDELLRRPELLGAYAEAFDRTADVTLVIECPGWAPARVTDELLPLADAHGLNEDGPDAVVLDGARSWPRERLAGVLTAQAGADPRVARFATADALRTCLGHAVIGATA